MNTATATAATAAAAKIPTSAFIIGTRTLSATTSLGLSSTFSFSLFHGYRNGSGLCSRLEKATIPWFQGRSSQHPSLPSQKNQQQRLLQPSLHHQRLGTATFSTSSMTCRSSLSKEEEDLYQALTVSFRTRLAEQIHKPEDEYKAVIEHWTAHSQKDALSRQRTRALKERLAAAIKHKDLGWIQKEQERLELEANGTADDYFYIIQAWIKCGELKRATMTFEKMEAMPSIPMTSRILAAMTRAHARAGTGAGAEAGSLAIAGTMVQKMKDLNLQPTSIYDASAVLEYYIKMAPALTSSLSESVSITTSVTATRESDPNHQQVEAVWKTIEPQVRLTISTAANNNASYSYRIYLLYLVGRAHDLERAAELIDTMTSRNVSPELEKYPKTAVNVIQQLCQHGYLTEVQQLLDQKEAALAKVLPQLTWSHLMEACMARGEDQKARWVYNDMIRYGIQPNSRCKKLFSDLQVKGGTVDRGRPDVAGISLGSGSGIESTATRKSDAEILNILFNRQSKPALS